MSIDIEQLLQQMGMSGGYQQSNPQGPTIGPPNMFGGNDTSFPQDVLNMPNIPPEKGDIIGNLIVGQKLRSLDELRAQRLRQEQPQTKMGKANEYLKAILSGFTHNEYKSPTKRAEELSQKDFQLETARNNSDAKDTQNQMMQQYHQMQMNQAKSVLAQRDASDKEKTKIAQQRANTSDLLAQLAKAKSPEDIAKVKAQIELIKGQTGELSNPSNLVKAVKERAQAKAEAEFEGKDLNDPQVRKALDKREAELREEGYVGLEKSQNQQVKMATDASGNVSLFGVNPKTMETTDIKNMGKIGKPSMSIVNPLSPEAVKMMAEQFKQSGEMPALGMGGLAARGAVLNAAAAGSTGNAPQSAADIIMNRQEAKANAAELTKLTTMRGQLKAFEGTAIKNLDILMGEAKKVIDTGTIPGNILFRGSAKMFGNTNAAGFEAARNVAFNEVARIVSQFGSTNILSDNSKKEANEILSKGYTYPQLVRVYKLLKQDMGNRVLSIDETIKENRERQKGKSNTYVAIPPTPQAATERRKALLKAIEEAK